MESANPSESRRDEERLAGQNPALPNVGDEDEETPGSATNKGDGNKKSPEREPSEAQCRENHDAEVGACEQATLRAASSCDENGSGLSAAVNAVADVSILAGQKSAAGIQDSCSKMGKVAQAANIAVMSYRQLCGAAISNCVTVCSAPLARKCSDAASDSKTSSAKAAMVGNMSSCQGFSGKMNQAAAAAQNYATLKANTDACAMMSDGTGAPSICATDPTAPGCVVQAKMDCSHPDMATNKVCICSKTPTAPECMSEKTDVTMSVAYASSEGRRAPPSAVAGALQDQVGFAITQGTVSPGGPDYSIDGKQGTGASLGSPNLQGSLKKRLRQAKPGPGTDVLVGFNSAGKASNKENEEGYEKLDLEGKGAAPAGAANPRPQADPELERFLPKPGSYRGIAGVGHGHRVDGITGPHSNIWMKVKNRYEAVKHTLLP